MLEKSPPHRVKGTAVFLTSDPDTAPAGAPAQPQAQQGAAREERDPDHQDRGHPRRERRRPGPDRARGRSLLAGRDDLRLHGDAEHPARARDPAQAGLQVRHHGDVVLPVAPLDPRPAAIPACRSGRTSCSSGSPSRRATRPTSSRSRPAACRGRTTWDRVRRNGRVAKSPSGSACLIRPEGRSPLAPQDRQTTAETPARPDRRGLPVHASSTKPSLP